MKGGRFYSMAWYHLRTGDTEKALRQFDHAIDVDSGNPIFYLGRGIAFVHTNDLERAMKDFDRVVKFDTRPTMPSSDRTQAYLSAAFFDRERVHLNKGAFALAVQDADQAIKHYSTNSAAHLIRGRALDSMQEHDRAIESFRSGDQTGSSLRSGPWAAAYGHSGNHDRAIADFDRAIDLNPIPANVAGSLAGRGFAYVNKGEYERAMRDFDEALKLDPRNAIALNNRCEVRAIVGALDEALADCHESLRIRPDLAPTLDSRGLVYLKKGALDDAIADYDAAIRIDPKLPYPLYGRGIAKRRKGDLAGSEADIAAAKAIYPGISDHFARYGIKE